MKKEIIKKDYEWIKIIVYDKKQFIIYIEDEDLFSVLEKLQKQGNEKKAEIFFYSHLNGEGELLEGFKIVLK
ncbi:hypothetical protein [Caldisericum sp.]|uniref:hypothetical protein n=1 Tax=Caldisericum sp. TaxID=2499687 RepID=UPI003D11051B